MVRAPGKAARVRHGRTGPGAGWGLERVQGAGVLSSPFAGGRGPYDRWAAGRAGGNEARVGGAAGRGETGRCRGCGGAGCAGVLGCGFTARRRGPALAGEGVARGCGLVAAVRPGSGGGRALRVPSGYVDAPGRYVDARAVGESPLSPPLGAAPPPPPAVSRPRDGPQLTARAAAGLEPERGDTGGPGTRCRPRRGRPFPGRISSRPRSRNQGGRKSPPGPRTSTRGVRAYGRINAVGKRYDTQPTAPEPALGREVVRK